jgi:hypothetical protein
MEVSVCGRAGELTGTVKAEHSSPLHFTPALHSPQGETQKLPPKSTLDRVWLNSPISRFHF